jgi:hypothetical protein
MSAVAMREKHHYIPVFYLKRWAGNDGRLCVYCRPHDRVKANRKHPDATGYEYDLYAIRGAGAEIAGHLEGRFLYSADNNAARALVYLETGRAAQLDVRLRSAWSRFVMTLLHRNPEAVAKWIGKAAQASAQAGEDFRANYATRRLPTDPETYEEYQLRAPEYYAARSAVTLLQKLMDHPDVGNDLNRMAWAVVRLRSSYSLLTSDRPLVMTNGISNPDSHLALPIGPRLLFIATKEPAMAHQLAQRDPNELATAVNDQVAAQARKFVWGLDDGQLRFVERRLGEMRPSSIMDLTE